MDKTNTDFGSLFRRFRLRSGLATLREVADLLAEKGYIYEESIFSHWQRNTRVPKDRKLLFVLIQIFLDRDGINNLKDINLFLASTGQGYLTEEELLRLNQKACLNRKLISAKKALDFLIKTNKSKRVIRTGWKREKVRDPESVAEHSFHLSIMAMIFADEFGVDREKLIKMAVIHDLGELITGDVVWSRGKMMDIEKRTNKESQEMQGIIDIFKIIGKGEEFRLIFEEMLERKTAEAKIFWQLDKLEMAIQALIYEKENNINLEEFFINTDLQLQSTFLRKIFDEVMKKRLSI